MSIIQFEDFPIGFAEDRNQLEDSTEFYVEWLDDSSEFPGLAAATSLNNANLNGGNWELLQRKELNDEDNIVEEDEGAWSKINTAEQNPLYAQIAEKNAADLQPTKRSIQPLWPVDAFASKEKKPEYIDQDDYQDDLGAELIDVQKSQSRRANRMSRIRNLHDLKTIDVHVEGIFRLATSRHGTTDVTWHPYDSSDQDLIIPSQQNTLVNLNLNTKSHALRYSARYKHNVQKFSWKTLKSSSVSKHPRFPDGGEYSVHSTIIKN